MSLAAGRLAPSGPASGFEAGNDFVALLGLSFAVIQLVETRRHPALRLAWASAALGSLMVAVEDHLETLAAPSIPHFAEIMLSSTFWLTASFLLVRCGRGYAMRRAVMVVMRIGFALAFAATALNLGMLAIGAVGPVWLAGLEDAIEFAATTTFVVGLLTTQLAPLKRYDFPADQIGRRARALFYDFGLETRRRYPAPQPALALPVVRSLLLLAIIARFLPTSSGAVVREHGVGVGAQFLELLRLGFIHGVDAKSYYVHELYRREAGLLDATMTRVETKNGLNRRIQDLRAHRSGPRDMNDKLEFFRCCEEHDVPSAPILATVENRALICMTSRDRFDRDLFVKDRRGRGGRFILTFDRVGPFLYRDHAGDLVNLDEAFAAIQSASADRRLIIQPKLCNHPAIRALADKALIVFRVMTCLDASGEPQVTHGVMRLLRRFEPDWPQTPDADWGCSIDPRSGRFGLLTGDAPETCTIWFERHPVTGEQIAGRRLAGWDAIAATALAAHKVFSTRVLVGWDIAWTPDGPVILEGNSNPDFSYFQRVSRTPVGRSPLGPLLNAHLDELMRRRLDDVARSQGRADAKFALAMLVKAKLVVDRFFERGVGGRAAGLLADVRFALWRRSNPEASYAAFYAHRASLRIDRGGAHKTLGLRHYRADPILGSVAHSPDSSGVRGRRYFDWFRERALRPDMVCVDYGCGSLRVGQHFIRHLDPGCYIGVDVVDRFYADGLHLLGSETVAAKRPYLATIEPRTLALVARRNPDLVYSTAVLQHVPPNELEAYFRAVISIMGPRSVAVMTFKRAAATRRIGSSAWAHSSEDLVGAALRAAPELRYAVEDADDHLGDPSQRQSALLISRSPEAIRLWLAPGRRSAGHVEAS